MDTNRQGREVAYQFTTKRQPTQATISARIPKDIIHPNEIERAGDALTCSPLETDELFILQPEIGNYGLLV